MIQITRAYHVPSHNMADDGSGFMFCILCGGGHKTKPESCPAWRRTCANCNVQNHFASQCQMVHGRQYLAVQQTETMYVSMPTLCFSFLIHILPNVFSIYSDSTYGVSSAGATRPTLIIDMPGPRVRPIISTFRSFPVLSQAEKRRIAGMQSAVIP